MAVIYEVNLQVKREVAEEFASWLEAHIKEMLALPGFVSATWSEVESDGDTEEQCWTVQYYLNQRSSLERYFQEYAEQMRGDGLQRFSGKFQAHRRIMEIRREYTEKGE